MSRYIKPQSNSKKTALIILVGALLMGGYEYISFQLAKRDKARMDSAEQSRISAQLETDVVVIERGESYARTDTDNSLLSIPAENRSFGEGGERQARIVPLELPETPFERISPEPNKNALAKVDTPQGSVRPSKAAPEKPSADKALNKNAKIVIIIDDVGLNRTMSNKVIDIDAPLTLAFLPYAPKLPEITQRAQAQGHELIIHMPMEPLNGALDTGPIALRANMTKDQVIAELDQAFESFDGYIGINNHMGSRITQDSAILNVVMDELAQRNLAFIDSKTIANSIAAEVAVAHGLKYAERDVFLDHEDNVGFVRKSLKKLEKVARAQGSAIAIGHPKAATIQGLREWLPTLKDKGIEIVPVSRVLKNGGSFANHVNTSSTSNTAKDLDQADKGKAHNHDEEGALSPLYGRPALHAHPAAATQIEPAAGGNILGSDIDAVKHAYGAAEKAQDAERKALKIEPFPPGIRPSAVSPPSQ